MTDTTGDPVAAGIDYVGVQESPQFQKLKKEQRSFIFPLTVIFLVWYFAYVLAAAFAPEFMSQRVWGDITIGLLLGLGQFVTTFAITMGYVSFANRKLDPQAREIREQLESQEARA